MRRFIVSSPAFAGNIDLVFREDVLIKIDATNANLPPVIMRIFKEKAPVQIDELETAFKGTHATIVEADFEIKLEDFIRDYPYKRNTHLLPEIWNKMSKADQVLAWQAAGEYRKYCQRNQSWYKAKIAAAWLKAKEYLNNWREL